MQNPTVFGIPNCDTVKKARAWCSAQGIAVVFHDFKKQGVPADAFADWVGQLGLHTLINRAGPTWRKLDGALQASVVDAASALAVVQAHSSVVKRPVVAWPDGVVTAGFTPALFAQRAAASGLL